MRNTTKTVLLMLLVAGTFAAAGIKNKLAQRQPNALAQTEWKSDMSGA